MFLRSLLDPNKSLWWTLFHIGFAFICTFFKFALIGWFYLILITNFGSALSQLRRGNYFILVALLIYLVSFEVLGRMAKTDPFIPSELGKYFLILFSLLVIGLKGIRSTMGMSMALLLLPGFFYDLSGMRTFVDIIYNIFGPLSAALGIAAFNRAKVTQNQMNQILHLVWYTSLAVLFFTYIKTPDLDSIEFSLSAQFETTADASSNQVSTILGLGMFLSFYGIINKLKFSGLYYGDIIIMLLFAFQGLLSFSRGGMIIAAMGMALLYFYNNRNKLKSNRGNLFFGGVVAILGLFIIFQVANKITDGNLLLRYSGETQGTLLGSKEKTADVLLSGRLTIMEEDFNLWLKHPITGVGAASSRFLRDRTQYVSPHIEFSRLLADHGLFGLMYFIVLLGVFQKAYRRLSKNDNKGLFIALVTVALLTTFHAAMRTYLSPTFFILATLWIIPDVQKTKINTPKSNQYPEFVPLT